MAKISYQFDEHSCALSSLRILTYLLTKKRGWKNMAFNSHPPYSLKTLEEEMEDYGFELTFFEAEKEEFSYPSNQNGPFLALLNENERTHMTVVTKIDDDQVTYLDPAVGKVVTKKEKFLSIWTGIYGVLVQTVIMKPPNAKRIVPIWREIVSDGLLFLAEVSLGLALAFLDRAPLWLTLTCMGLALVLEEGRRLFILSSIKEFDKKYLSAVYDEDPKRIKTNYERYNLLKKSLFADVASIISQIGACLLIAVIVGMNSPSFFLSLGGVLALLCGEKFIFHRYFYTKRVRMQKEEQLLYGSSEEAEKRQLLFSLSQDADKYGKMMLIEKAILTITMAAFSILPSIMANDSSLNYYLFHLFALLFIQKGGSDVFEYAFNRKEREKNLLYFREYLSKISS